MTYVYVCLVILAAAGAALNFRRLRQGHPQRASHTWVFLLAVLCVAFVAALAATLLNQ